MFRILNTVFMVLAFALAAIAQPGGRIKLTQLEQAPEIDGSRIAMIGLSNAAGDQRYAYYVNVNDTCMADAPTALGNTIVSIFWQKCATDSIWYVDWEGRSILLAPYGGGGTNDMDWLEIADNNIPDAITDSIYTYKYASIGARYVWPSAKLLVNDSLAAALQVTQGFRNARVALYDLQGNTWTMLDHGGSSPIMYFPNNGTYTFRTADGTPETPGLTQVSHFAINAQDSTIQAQQYPNTRVDTNTIVNFLYTDPVGKFRSRPAADVVAAGLSMPDMEIVSGTGTGITSSSDFTHDIAGNAVNSNDTVNTSRPVRSNVPTGWYGKLLGRPDLGFLAQHTLNDPLSLTQASVAYNNWNVGITTTDNAQTSAPGLRFYKAMVDGSGNAIPPTAGQVLSIFATQSHRGQTTSLGDMYGKTNGAFFLETKIDSVGATGEVSTITSLYAKPITGSSAAPSGVPFIYGNGVQDVYFPGYDDTRDDPGSGAVFLSVDASNRMTAHPVSDLPGGDISNGGDSFGSAITIGSNDNFALNLESNGTTGFSLGTNQSATFTAETASTTTADNRVIIQTNSTGTPGAGFGSSLLFQGESSTTENRDMAKFSTYWENATDGTRSSRAKISLMSLGTLYDHYTFDRTGLSISNFAGASASKYSNSGITTGASFSIGSSTNTLDLFSNTSSSGAVNIYNNSVTGSVGFYRGISINVLSGTKNWVDITPTTSPTSGAAISNFLGIAPVVNQTGTANGLFRGIYINPTITSLLGSFYGIDISINSVSAKGVFQSGPNTSNNFAGNTTFGSTAAAGTEVDVVGTVSTEHLIGQNQTPTIAVESSAGTGASASMVNAQSSDLAGRFSITTGTSATSGLWATITFDDSFSLAPIVHVYSEDADAAGLTHYVNVSTTSFEFFINSGESDATTHDFSFIVIGGK